MMAANKPNPEPLTFELRVTKTYPPFSDNHNGWAWQFTFGGYVVSEGKCGRGPACDYGSWRYPRTAEYVEYAERDIRNMAMNTVMDGFRRALAPPPKIVPPEIVIDRCPNPSVRERPLWVEPLVLWSLVTISIIALVLIVTFN